MAIALGGGFGESGCNPKGSRPAQAYFFSAPESVPRPCSVSQDTAGPLRCLQETPLNGRVACRAASVPSPWQAGAGPDTGSAFRLVRRRAPSRYGGRSRRRRVCRRSNRSHVGTSLLSLLATKFPHFSAMSQSRGEGFAEGSGYGVKQRGPPLASPRRSGSPPDRLRAWYPLCSNSRWAK